jgi:hypothetical protein
MPIKNLQYENDIIIPLKSFSRIVYFDTNIVRDLAECRVPNAIQKTNLIKERIQRGELAIAPSFEVLEEILSSPDISREIQIQNAKFYEGIVAWKYAIKPSNQILIEDSDRCAKGLGPSVPFCELGGDLIQSLRNGNMIFSEEEWKEVVRKSRKQNKQFIEQLFKQFVRQLPSDIKQRLKNSPQETWEEWWKEKDIAEKLAGSLTVGKKIRISYCPLALPTLRAAAGYLLDTWYNQILNGLKVKPTSHVDFRNAVIGASVGKIVTKDKKFTRAIHHIPKLDMAMIVLTLDEFIENIKGQIGV